MYNKVTILREVKGEKIEQQMIYGTGRLTNDPPAIVEVGDNKTKILRGNKDHKFAIAFPDPTLGKDDQGRPKSKFYSINAWASIAEQLAKVGFKGQTVEVAARIEVQNYTKNDGSPGQNEVLVIERFDAKEYKNRGNGIGNGNGNGADSGNASQGNDAGSQSTDSTSQQRDPFVDDGKPIDIDEDDIPF